MRSHYFDRQGKPLWNDIMAWGKLRDDESYMRLGHDVVGEADVLTVWQGMNLVLGADPPMIFETRIFGGPHDLEGTNYVTESQAREGHSRVVENMRAGRGPWTDEHLADGHGGEPCAICDEEFFELEEATGSPGPGEKEE